MQDWLTQRAQRSPQAPAVRFGQSGWTYAQMARRAEQYAARFVGQGIRAGDFVGLWLQNSPEYMALIHALWRLGAVPVPLNTRLTAGECVALVNRARCGVVIADQSLLDAACPVYTLSAFENLPAASDLPVIHPDLTHPAALIFTSGTTGQPKGVILSRGNLFYSATASAYRLGTLPDDEWLCVLPLYHVGGLSIVARACLYGITVQLHPAFDLETVNAALGNPPVSMVSLVPTMLYRLLEHGTPERWSSSLRLILLGGAAASPELMARCAALMLPVATTYGMSEAASQVATLPPPDTYDKPGSVGQPLMFTDVRIVDEAGRDMPPGEYGEILVSGPTVMAGYLDDADATARTLRDGYLHTGDMGYLDAAGDLWVVQRRTDLIVSGGENVYPAEVEAVLRQHPAIAEVCVVGVDDAEWGQQVAAALVPRPDQTIDLNVIEQHCRAQLAGYKIPRRLKIVDALPLTASGKVRRAAIREMMQHAIS